MKVPSAQSEVRIRYGDEGPLPKLTEEQAQSLHARFLALTSRLNLSQAPTSPWWFTWLSSRDSFNSRLWNLMIWATKVEAALEQARRDRVEAVVSVQNPLQAEVVTRLCLVHGSYAHRPRFLKRWRHGKPCYPLRRWLAQILFFLRWVGAREARSHPLPAGVDVMLITQLTEGPLRRDGAYRDTYFGDLAAHLEKAGETVLTVGGIQGDPRRVMGALARRPEAIASLARFLSPMDILREAIRAWFSKVEVPDGLDYLGIDFAPMVRAEVREARGDILLGRLYYEAAGRLFARYPGVRVVHMYENNPWERAIDRAATERGIKDVRGFLHCAVLASHLKNYLARGEKAMRPSPGRIICTGPLAREVFLGLGEHDPATVDVGCDLRGGGGVPGPPRGLRPVKTILAVLEGLPNMVHLLRLIDEAARAMPEVRFWVRGHPALPLETLVERAGIVLGQGGAEVCPIEDLSAAIEKADAMLYQGTTVALSAVAKGVPVIRAALNEALNDDPLLHCDALKSEITSAGALPAVVDQLNAMSPRGYTRQAARAQAYVADYQRVVDEGGLTAFGPGPGGSRQ